MHALKLGGVGKERFLVELKEGRSPMDALHSNLRYIEKHSEAYLGYYYNYQPIQAMPYVAFITFVLRRQWMYASGDTVQLTNKCRAALIHWFDESEKTLGNSGQVGASSVPDEVINLKFDPTSDAEMRIKVLDMTLEGLIPYIQNQQGRWIDWHKIGTALTTGNVNGPLDIMVRTF
jgi:hypothetical protein